MRRRPVHNRRSEPHTWYALGSTGLQYSHGHGLRKDKDFATDTLIDTGDVQRHASARGTACKALTGLSVGVSKAN